MDGQNYLVFHNDSNDSYMNSSANFRGADVGTTFIDMYFNSANVGGNGINVVTGEEVDMVKAGVIDPVLVTKTALKNAVSVVSTIISADCVISNMRMNESNQ